MFSVDDMLFEKEKISFYIGYGKKLKHCQVNEYPPFEYHGLLGSSSSKSFTVQNGHLRYF